MRLSELRDKKVLNLDGETLGRIHEVHCDGGKVTALMCGARSLIERWTARPQGRRIPWEDVVRIEPGRVIVASGSRSRPSTRRPSAPRSMR